jgi:PTH1 family peptidyl-tRNA hydrolase
VSDAVGDHAEARIRGAFRSQGASCESLGSPFMARLMPLIGARLTPGTAVGARVLSWPGDAGPAGQSVPLRLAGALHGLVLDGTDAGLMAVYPPQEATDTALWAAIQQSLCRHEARIMAWLDQAPQTNEIRRSVALLPAIWWLCERVGATPELILSELGASAGLNLQIDHYAIETPAGLSGPETPSIRLKPDWQGAPLPQPATLRIVDRAGVDRNPMDVRDPDAALRLLSYLWADQPERLALTRAAFRLVESPPARGDAAPWLRDRLATWRERSQAAASLHVVFNTIAWQYFPPETQAACANALEAAGAVARADKALAHVALEADGRRDGAALSVRLWPHAPEPRLLARVDFHGRRVDWHG